MSISYKGKSKIYGHYDQKKLSQYLCFCKLSVVYNDKICLYPIQSDIQGVNIELYRGSERNYYYYYHYYYYYYYYYYYKGKIMGKGVDY